MMAFVRLCWQVLMKQKNPADAFIQNYMVLIGDSSFSNFQKVLDLKGTPRSEANALLDKFVTFTSTKDDLANTSFLSSLDMDPATTTTIHTISPTASGASLPLLLVGGQAVSDVAAAVLSPPPGDATKLDGQKREVFSDLRRFVSFAIRRERENTAPPVL